MSALAPHLAAIDAEIRRLIASDGDPRLTSFFEMMLYHLGLEGAAAGGKRVRPLICLLVHEGLTGDHRPALPAAAALELLHNFTLIHDDIEDQDRTRRHRPTVWSVWGVPQAINAGDGMYALSRVAVQALRQRGLADRRVLDAAAALDRACLEVCEGQFLDISFEERDDVSAEEYRAMVERKTGALFLASAKIGGMLATDDREVLEALGAFGSRFGAAFQAHDDLMGIWGTTAATGKAEMHDIAKRKKTLPLVLALERAAPPQREALRAPYAAEGSLSTDAVRHVRDLLDATRVRAEVERFVADERGEALAALEGAGLREPARSLLRDLAVETTSGL